MKNGFVTVYFFGENLKKHKILSDFWRKMFFFHFEGVKLFEKNILFFSQIFKNF